MSACLRTLSLLNAAGQSNFSLLSHSKASSTSIPRYLTVLSNLFDPIADRVASGLRYLELNRSGGLLLHDDGTG
jgi:hypothetical protein